LCFNRWKKGEIAMRRNFTTAFAITIAVMITLTFSVGAFASQAEKVNINKASVEELSTLKYIGEKSAQKIVAYREKNGPFKSIEDLVNVPGVGPKTLEVNKDKITIN
jgi:competence ComEA-like helix-hairpin-helix protein